LSKSVTILTVSKRQGWEKQAIKSIRAQTIGAYSWIVIQENLRANWSSFLMPMNVQHFIAHYAPETNNPSNLNASLNAGLRLIETDYVIFYQDFIELPADCFEKLLALAEPDTFVTTCTPNYNGSNDGRYLGVDCPRPCRPEEWETNVAIAPVGMLYELGGFPEHYDKGWSWDNVNVAERAEMLGAKFILDESNRPKLLPHEQTSKLAMQPNGEFHVQEMKDIKAGIKPLSYHYL